MFEINMDEYLDEEVESVKNSLELICKDWDKQVCVSQATRRPAILIRVIGRRACAELNRQHRALPRLTQSRSSQEKRPRIIHQRPPSPCHHRPTRSRWCDNDGRQRRLPGHSYVKPPTMGR